MKDEAAILNKIQIDPFSKGAFGRSLKIILARIKLNPKNFRFKICKEIFLTIPVVIYTQKNFYLLDEFDAIIEVLKSSGLIQLWESSVNFHDRFSTGISNYTKNMKALTLHDLEGCFYILVSGSIAGLFAYILEFLYSLGIAAIVEFFHRRL